jgi:hypothetical protein
MKCINCGSPDSKVWFGGIRGFQCKECWEMKKDREAQPYWPAGTDEDMEKAVGRWQKYFGNGGKIPDG